MSKDNKEVKTNGEYIDIRPSLKKNKNRIVAIAMVIALLFPTIAGIIAMLIPQPEIEYSTTITGVHETHVEQPIDKTDEKEPEEAASETTEEDASETTEVKPTTEVK